MLSFQLLAQNDAPDVALWGGGMFVVMMILGLIALAVWIWALVDAIRNPALDGTMRLVWILVILFGNLLGAIIYLLVGRSRMPHTTAPRV